MGGGGGEALWFHYEAQYFFALLINNSYSKTTVRVLYATSVKNISTAVTANLIIIIGVTIFIFCHI
jgi:hypothetical protein